MAQQPLCRVGTHEEEQRSAEAEAKQAEEANRNLLKLRIPTGKVCPDRLKSLLPPSNFGAVIPGKVYRSSMPEPENFAFLSSLKLKTILTLVPEFRPEYAVWIAESSIKHIILPVPANKEVVRIEAATILQALAVVLDPSNYPLLIHCNKGKHRTGCVVGCLRKVQGEPMPEIINEYHAYADPKARILDEMFMEEFDERAMLWLARENGLLPPDEPGSASPFVKSSTPVSRMRN